MKRQITIKIIAAAALLGGLLILQPTHVGQNSLSAQCNTTIAAEMHITPTAWTTGAQIASFNPIPEAIAVLQPPPPAPTVLMDKMLVAQPAANRTVTNAAGFNFFGSGVAGVAMYVNGQLITNRTAEGFFSVFMPLVRGINDFTFTQAGQPDITRRITNNAPAPPTAPSTIGAAQIRNPFPQTDEWVTSGNAVVLRVTAPAGAAVTAQIGGERINLTQTNPNLTSTSDIVLAAEFTATFTMPDIAAGAVTAIGRPVYTMTFRGNTASITSPGYLRQIGVNAPFYATITADAAWAFVGPTTVGGSHWKLLEGQRDRITAITGDWIRLASGQWVQRVNVNTLVNDDAAATRHALSAAIYHVGEREDRIIWGSETFPAMWAEFDGNTLIVGVAKHSTAPRIFVPRPDDALFESIEIGTHRGAAAYFMQLREGASLEGFYFEHHDEMLHLVLRRRPSLNQDNGRYPLYGLTFVIDPGHGGTDPGALGPMGGELAEMHLNLIYSDLLARRLTDLGAQVILTREDDYNLQLAERVDINRAAKPDMFISMHANSTAETTNASGIHGFTIWYRNANARPLAMCFMDALYDINPLTNRHRSVNHANFYVNRPSWTPSVLFEISFMNNINDFAWMICPRNQEVFAARTVRAILEYFGE